MKVLMFGWEFPPYTSGGLGTACYHLTKGLAQNGADVTFVVPFAADGTDDDFVRLLGVQLQHIRLRAIPSLLSPYMGEGDYQKRLRKLGNNFLQLYGHNLYHEVARFAQAARDIALHEPHEVIHCHDWMTYPAGIVAKQVSGKPLVVHIHNTVFDRSSLQPNGYEYAIEKAGFEEADMIIAISQHVKDNLVQRYHVNPQKVVVVHWGIDQDDPAYAIASPQKGVREKIVLFVGRITLQKGPDYFIEAARKVLDLEPNTRFVIVGEGDMLPQIIHRSIELGMSDKVSFNGWFQKQDVFKAFKMADVFVMPSVSEPFGLVALEALKNGTPVIVSKQSGVAEVVQHCLKVDFWDVQELANKILAVLRYRSLQHELRANGTEESKKFTLDAPAKKVLAAYGQVVRHG